jgi:phage tail sheath gpL-like
MPAIATVTVETSDGALSPFASGVVTASKKGRLQKFANILNAAASGLRRGTVRYGTAVAAGTLTLSGGSGAVGGVINGVTVTATWATSDAVSAGLVAAAINASANPLVSEHVTAAANGAVVTLTSRRAGPGGNAVTLVASGTGVTASGARLTGGTETTLTR